MIERLLGWNRQGLLQALYSLLLQSPMIGGTIVTVLDNGPSLIGH